MTTEVVKAEKVDKGGGRRFTNRQREAQELECIRLKILGTRDQEIAEMVGISRVTVWKRLTSGLAKQTSLKAQEYREIQNQQLEVLLQACMPGIQAGNPESISAALRIMDRKAKLLGLDAPVQVEATVTQVTQQERELADLVAQAERDSRAREETLIEGEVVA